MSWKTLTEKEMESTEFEDNAEFWNPEKDDVLQGTVKVVKMGKYEKLFMVIEDDEGLTWITTQCGSLDRQIRRQQIEQGDIVQLLYKGRKDDEYQTHMYILKKWEDEE